MIQLFVELFQLGCLCHCISVHEERGLVGGVAFTVQEFKTVLDEGKVEEDAISSQTIATVADNLDAALRIVPGQACEHFVMRQALFLLHLCVLRGPIANELVLVLEEVSVELHMVPCESVSYLVVEVGYRIMDVIPDAFHFSIEGDFLLGGLLLEQFFLSLQVLLLLNQVVRVFFRLASTSRQYGTRLQHINWI